MKSTIKKTSKQSVTKVPRMRDVTDLLDGAVRIFRTTASGDVWQMRMYVPKEQKYVRKSLKTRDKEIASQRARDICFEVWGKVQSGQKVFSITTEQLRDRYLEYIKELVSDGQMSAGRERNIKTFTRHYMNFLGRNETIQNIPERKFSEYRKFRQEKLPNITMTVVVNESITIKQMYRWAANEGLIGKNYVPDFGKIKVRSDDTKRDGFTLEEYTQLVGVAGRWYQRVPKDHPAPKQEIYYRRSMRDFIVLMANFGFRTGELINLQYKNIKTHSDKSATVLVAADTTKVKAKREVRGRRGDVFARRKTYSPFHDREDYVFSNYSSKSPMSRETLYAYYHALVQEVKEKYPHFDDTKTPYSLRHFYITYQLLVGSVNAYEIAKIAGTSVKQIEAHYDHVQNSHIAKKILGTETRIDKKNWEIIVDDISLYETKHDQTR